MAFLLLIFFMVSTTFPKEKPRKLDFPDAEATQKLDTRGRTFCVYLGATARLHQRCPDPDGSGVGHRGAGYAQSD